MVGYHTGLCRDAVLVNSRTGLPYADSCRRVDEVEDNSVGLEIIVVLPMRCVFRWRSITF